MVSSNGHAGEPPGDETGQQHVLVLGVDDLGALGADGARQLEPAPDREERVQEHALGHDRAAGRALDREGEAADAEPVALLERGRAVVGRDDDHALPVARESPGQRLSAPLGAARRVRREILVRETDVHAAASRTVA